jgi:hypothetical protein
VGSDVKQTAEFRLKAQEVKQAHAWVLIEGRAVREVLIMAFGWRSSIFRTESEQEALEMLGRTGAKIAERTVDLQANERLKKLTRS